VFSPSWSRSLDIVHYRLPQLLDALDAACGSRVSITPPPCSGDYVVLGPLSCTLPLPLLRSVFSLPCSLYSPDSCVIREFPSFAFSFQWGVCSEKPASPSSRPFFPKILAVFQLSLHLSSHLTSVCSFFPPLLLRVSALSARLPDNGLNLFAHCLPCTLLSLLLGGPRFPLHDLTFRTSCR